MTKTNKKNYLVAIIGFAWFFIVLLGYFVTHKPFSSSQLLIVVSHLWKFFLVSWLISIAGGIGNFVLKKIKDHPGEWFYLEVSLGLGLFSIFILLLGSIWKINLVINLILLVLLSFLFFRNIKTWIKRLFQLVRDVRIESSFTKFLAVIIGIIFISQLVIAFAPAFRYDSLNYHLTLPKAYLFQERITDIPWLVMSGMPQISEMIYLVLMSLGGESSILVFNWVIGTLIGLGLFSFIENRLNGEVAWVTVASLFGGYTFSSALSWGYVDLMAAFFGLAVFLAWVEFYEKRNYPYLLLSGVFCGLAFGCKYPAGVIFLALFFTLLFLIFRKKIDHPIKALVCFCLGAALFALPWLLKNLVFSGNPVYPFFFESGSMTEIRLNVYQGLVPYGNLLDLFFLPLQATILGVEGTHGYSVSIGPFLLGLGVLAFINWDSKTENHKTIISLAGLISLFGLIIWAVGNQFSGYLIQTRFYFVLFPIFAILAGFGYFQLSSFSFSRVRLYRLIQPLIILVLAFNAFQLTSEMVEKGALKNLFGQISNQQYLEDNLGWYARAINDIRYLPEDSKVLLIYEPRGYGCIPKCDPDEILDHWKVIYHQIETNEKIISAWMNDGYTHLLVHTKGIEFLRENNDPHHPVEELDALEKLLEKINLIENYDGWYKLYMFEPD